jgi:hypothetical protein
MSLAASLTIVAAGAAVVMRPEWFGLRAEPEHVQQVEVQRPNVVVAVPTPVAPVATVVEPPPVDPAVVQPPPVDPVVAVEPQPVEPQPVEPQPVEPQPVEPAPVEPQPVEPVVVAPPVVQPAPPVVPIPVRPADSWPVEDSGVDTTRPDSTARKTPSLVRVNEDLMIGEQVDVTDRERVKGILPGARAFAQLHNGNFFIGSVKSASSERITLRVDSGEVTLPVEAIARLTELGSVDYEELQRVTSGFVRLRNNNRLVGGILSNIADDHVVLEFRKNRVILPRSLVGEVVQGESESAIRIDTTSEEDDWLRRLAEREVGAGANGAAPAPVPAPAPAPGDRSPR